MTATNVFQRDASTTQPVKAARQTQRHRRSVPEFASELFLTPESFTTSMAAKTDGLLAQSTPASNKWYFANSQIGESAHSTTSFSRSLSDPLTSKFWSGSPELDDDFDNFIHPCPEPVGNRAAQNVKTEESGKAKADSKRERRRQQNRTAQQVYRARQTSMLNSYRCQRDHARAEVAELRRRMSQHQQTRALSLQVLRKELLSAVENFEKSLQIAPPFPQPASCSTDSESDTTHTTCHIHAQQGMFSTNGYTQCHLDYGRFKDELQQKEVFLDHHQTTSCGLESTIAMTELSNVSITELMALPAEELSENALFAPMAGDALDSNGGLPSESPSMLDPQRL